MRAFTVYPKGGDEEFPINLDSYEIGDGNRIILRTETGKESTFAYIQSDSIAAIVPTEAPHKNWGKDNPNFEITYLVYLKKRDRPIKVYAGALDPSGPHLIRFFHLLSQHPGDFNRTPLDDIYLVKSEVIAIFPEDGLVRRWGLE